MAVLEGLGDLADAVPEDVGEAEQDGQLDAARRAADRRVP